MNARHLALPAAGTAVLVVVLAGSSGASYRTLLAVSGSGIVTPAPGATLTLDVTGIAATGLYPNGPGGAVTIAVTNPYSRAITVTGISAAGSVVATPLAGSTCATTGVTVVAPSSGLPFTVAAGATGTATLPAVVRMGATADGGCQGATFTIPFTVSGRL